MPPPAKISDKQFPARNPVNGAITSVGLLGARGHAGRELLRLIHQHPHLELAFATSSSNEGEPIQPVDPESKSSLLYEDTSPRVAANNTADVYILALPNGESAPYIEAIESAYDKDRRIIDLSADHRFDSDWAYGLSELNAPMLRSAKRIANPGCYATEMMLALSPLASILEATPHVFGVSGYSGAGATPSPRNDPDVLRDNLLPYQLAGHLHEREVTHQLGRSIRFAPHVAPFFRGITATILAGLSEPINLANLIGLYEERYCDQPLIEILPEESPLVRDAAHRVQATIGGFTVDGHEPSRISMVVTLDNLLKGAASQAIQNINLTCGFEPMEGLRP